MFPIQVSSLEHGFDDYRFNLAVGYLVLSRTDKLSSKTKPKSHQLSLGSRFNQRSYMAHSENIPSPKQTF